MGSSDGTIIGATKILDNGPNDSKFNIVLVAEGFTNSEQDDFNNVCNEFVSKLQAETWFPDLGEAISVHRLNVSSIESGADDPEDCADGTSGSGTSVRTYFDGSFCNSGSRRVIRGDNTLVRDTLDENVPEWQVASVLVNTTQYGGSASGNVFWTALSSTWKDVVLHEFGHSVGMLGEEYDCQSDQDDDDSFETVWPNVTKVTDRNMLKWKHRVDPEIPIPTMQNPDCTKGDTTPNVLDDDLKIGLFEGAGEYHCGRYRPAYNCKMRESAQPFCRVCVDALADGLSEFLPVVTLETQTITFDDIPEGETHYRAISFSISSLTPLHFEVDEPVVTNGPPGSFELPAGSTISLESDEDLKNGKAYVWISHTGTSDGDSATGEVTVRNIERNKEWPRIPITANTVRRSTVAVALVLDRSGSMDNSSGLGAPLLQSRIEVLRFAANHFIDVIRENNAIGIVSFNHDALEEMPVTHLNTIDPTESPRKTAKAKIENITPGGQTSIGNGIEIAHDMLNPETGYDTKATIVFTDGHENAGKRISDVADIINEEKVFAIGLGTAQQLNPGPLDAITKGTGGYLLLTGKLNPDYDFLLSKYFLQILAGVTNEDIVRDPEGWIKLGQEHRIPFRLNEEDISTDIILIQQSGITTISGPPIDVSVVHFNVFKFLIESPNGDIIDPIVASTIPGVSYVDGTNLSFYRAGLPLPIGESPVSTGIWHAILTIDEEGYKKYLSSLDNYPKLKETIKTHGIRYNLTVHAYSNVRMRSTLSQNSYEPGATMSLRTRLTQYGRPLKSTATTVRADLRRPDNTSSTFNLLEVEDGVFETSILAMMSGIYHFRVYCNGVTLGGRPFTREQMLTGAVWQYGDQPPPTRKDDPRERDERLCKLLECILSKEVISQELERRLSAVGINIDILRRCVIAYCKDTSLSPESRVVPKNELSSLLQDPTILAFVKRVVEEMQRNRM